MKLTFWGATRQVTGSMHMVQLPNGYTILIDCGLDYEQQKRFGSLGDVEFPFHPQDINAVILTHSHIDHSGNLPSLVKQGFRGKIICTPATADITGLLLIDSLNIMEMERNQSNKGKSGKGGSKKMPFGYKHLRETVERIIPVTLNKNFRITNGVDMEFFNSGHILGAASVLLKVHDGEKEIRIGFTGDLGNYDSQLVPDAQPMGELDYLISESTYGGRTHLAQRSPTDELLHYINLACVENPGRLIIPAFSVGRTHAIAFTFHQLYRQGRLPNVRIFADSPLAIKTARYHHKYIETLNKEAQDMYRRHKDLFEFENLEFVEDAKNSDWLKYEPDPCVIISAAGMVEGGRIQQHIRANISNPSSHILIAGFCAEGTLGYRLLQGQSTLSMKGKDLPVYASIHKTDAFSAHPDNTGLVRYISEANSPKLKKVFLVHGEETSMMALRNNLIAQGITQVETPQKGQSFEI